MMNRPQDTDSCRICDADCLSPCSTDPASLENKNPDKYAYLPLMTISETAKYMGVGRKTIYQLIEFGELRAFRSQRTTLVEKLSVDAYLASKKLT